MTSNSLRVENCPSHCTTPSERNDQHHVAVQVGCLHINPATPRGLRIFMVQMLALCFVPHAALVVQNCSAMAQLSQTLDASLYLHDEVSSTLALGDAVAALQEERLLISRVLLSNSNQEIDRLYFERLFAATDSRIADLSIALQDHYKSELYNLRDDFINAINQRRWEKMNYLNRMSVYGEINSVLLLYFTRQVKSTTSSLWRQLSACYELVKGVEDLSLVFISVGLHEEDVDKKGIANLEQRHVSALDHLGSTLTYLKVENAGELTDLEEVYRFYKSVHSWRNDTSPGALVTYYMTESELCLVNLREIQIQLWKITRESVKNEVWVARRTLAIGVVILTMVLLASPVLVLLIRYTVNTIQTFNRSVEVSTQQLVIEKQKSDLLLSRMLPTPVLRKLKAEKTVPAEAFDAVTIFFSDIVGFTTISANSTPMEVINMLNMLYKLFDERISKYNVYKVETIGDAYMVVSGLPQKNGNRHASEIADMSLSLMRSLEGARVPHRPSEALRIRAGVNTGPCVAGVVGTTMPRYCLFGDTINVASRMETTGEPMKIHISDTTKTELDAIGGYETQPRGDVDIAGKGKMETYWLLGKIGGVQMESPRCLRFHDYEQNLLELLIKA